VEHQQNKKPQSAVHPTRQQQPDNQPMVILENTTPETGALGVTPMQLSEWDRMIKQQFNRSTN
jgi:hypothetical protein